MFLDDIKGYFAAPANDLTVKSREKYLSIFITAFLGMLVALLPCMIKNGGIFTYYGDFNTQQLMFYKHCHELVRSGNFSWDWGTDLGTGVVGTWSFYLFGSPFFWLTIPFPTSWTVYLMPWLLCLKVGLAALFAYMYLRRFITNKDAAFIGAMLYAFSGFQTYNVFFNHFHDVTAFFPLLLLTFEMTVKDDKKGLFALMVALSACISYFFFVGEVVFMVIYFVLRCFDKDFRDCLTFSKLLTLAVESVLGFLVAAVLILPSLSNVSGNFRVKRGFIGLDFILYKDKARIGRIFQAFFTLSDMPARINIFDVDTARWASLAGYLPLFSMSGVIAYYLHKKQNGKRDWLCWGLIVFVIMACVPFLNSAFILFNSNYYARWFYMPILLFCLMTAKVLDEDMSVLRKGFFPTAIAGIGFLCVGSLPKYVDGKYTFFHLAVYPELYHIQVIVTLMMIVLLGIVVFVLFHKNVKSRLNVIRIIVWLTVIGCVICNSSEIQYGVAQGFKEKKDYVDVAINGKKNLDIDRLESKSKYKNASNSFYRIDTSPNVDNYCMFWGLSSMRTFQSTVVSSIINFYQGIGQKRDVASRMEPNLYPLRSLLSVKYYFNKSNDEKAPQKVKDLTDFTFTARQNSFNIYENENFIPMGFAFDCYTTDAVLKKADKLEMPHILLKALVLDDKQVSRYSDILTEHHFTKDDYKVETFRQNCADRRAESCYSFTHDNKSFTGRIKLNAEKLVFFSVPFDKGWSAVVNGKSARVEKVDYGLMAVCVPAGDNEIKFTYHAVGQTAGIIITIIALLLLALYMAYYRFAAKNVKTVSAAAESAPIAVDTTEQVTESAPVEPEITEAESDNSQPEL